MSTFMSYYILKAVASFDKAAAVAMMKEYYGAMLQKGATTFWEDFEMEWMENTNTLTTFPTEGQKDIHGDFGKFCYEGFRHSLCHGWASGPTAFLSRYVLGIWIEDAGCKKVSIKPQLGNLKWAKGKFPTPYGEIKVEHTLVDGEVVTKVSAPKEIEVNIAK